MSSKQKELEEKQDNKDILYTYCLNCGTELNGKFCHECGQHAKQVKPTVKDFVMEYLSNAFIWDPQCVKTIWALLRRPGYLTNEYMSGKFISQENPLKLNMFLLFVFVSMFLIFSSGKEADNAIDDFTYNELVYPVLQLDFLKEDADYTNKMRESTRDTVMLYAPLKILENHSDIITKVEVLENSNGERADKWVAVIPRVLIDDSIVVVNEDNYHIFNTDKTIMADAFEEFRSVWTKMADFTTTYFPMLMLLTTPLLAFSLALIQRRNKKPLIHHFIFALHYTAFIEVLIMLIYALYLIADPSSELLTWIIRIGASAYLIAAFRRVYEPNSWLKSIFKALLTYIVYLFNCILIFFVIFVVICFIVALV